MSNWKLYSRGPISMARICRGRRNRNSPVMPNTSHIGRLDDPEDHRAAHRFGFDPAHTYFTTLLRDWRGHPAGSRVLLEATEVAIEDGASAKPAEWIEATNPAVVTG